MIMVKKTIVVNKLPVLVSDAAIMEPWYSNPPEPREHTIPAHSNYSKPMFKCQTKGKLGQ